MATALKGSQAYFSKMKAEIRQFSARVNAEMAMGQVVNIRKRLAAGLGIDDAPMPDYTEAYAKKKGRSGPRDLLVTGTMLRSMQVKLSGKTATIFFADARSRLIAEEHDRRHPWFGVSPQDQRNLKLLLQRIANEVGL